jgi:hypothetical protein
MHQNDLKTLKNIKLKQRKKNQIFLKTLMQKQLGYSGAFVWSLQKPKILKMQLPYLFYSFSKFNQFRR